VQHVIVQRGLLDTTLLQGAHYGADFILTEDEISHGHRVSAGDLLERDP
jgi:hypothetical protein